MLGLQQFCSQCLCFISAGRRIKGDYARGRVLNNKRERKNNIIYDKKQQGAYKHIYQRVLWCCHKDRHSNPVLHFIGGKRTLHRAEHLSLVSTKSLFHSLQLKGEFPPPLFRNKKILLKAINHLLMLLKENQLLSRY